ncbi:MAG: class I SAM-dependent methyltransferase [Pseudomonadota bacterium]
MVSALKFTPDMELVARVAAAQYDTGPQLHESDHLLRYIVEAADAETGIANYFRGGFKDAKSIKRVLEALSIERANQKILDFASGYGRVVRHLNGMLPDHEVYASDIHPEAVEFMNGELGIQSYVSSHAPEDLDIGADYDFIYAMSLFSHLPKASFGRWLQALYERLAVGGFLMFTTHGQLAIDRHPEFFGGIFDNQEGCGYRTESDQLDLDGEEYGSMVVSMQFVLDVVEKYAKGARVHQFESGAVMSIQDKWVIKRVG